MTTVTDKDKGYGNLLRKVVGVVGEQEITVGVHSDAGGRNLEVATYHEFGTSTIPERSFIRAWADENEAKNQKTLRQALESWILVRQNQSILRPLNRTAALFVASIKSRITGGIPPELAASTVARKGSSTPLIDTAQLLSSIASKVNGS